MRRIALLTLFGLAACSGGAPTDTPTPFVGPENGALVSLRNATDGPIVYLAVGEGALALIDLRPTLARGEYEGRLVQPGETAAVTDIIGYDRALGVGFHLYRVDPATGDARYAGHLLATAAELARSDGLVTVTSLGP